MRLYEIDAGQKISFRPETTGYNAPPELAEVEKVFELIKRDCGESLAAMKNARKWMFRGIKDTQYATPIMFHGRSRENRRPMSTSYDIDNQLNQGLANSGFKAIRSNSIFCTSSLGATSLYGNAYFIFPINGFSFTWNTEYDDFYTDYIHRYMRHRSDEEQNQEAERAREEFAQLSQTPDFAHVYKFIDVGLDSALSYGHEIMVSGEYYALYRADFNQYIDKVLR